MSLAWVIFTACDDKPKLLIPADLAAFRRARNMLTVYMATWSIDVDCIHRLVAFLCLKTISHPASSDLRK